jgi:hypothetical protein
LKRDIGGLSTRQISVLSTAQMQGLLPEQLAALTTTQMHTLTVSQYNELSAAQKAAFSPAQIAALTFITPLVLDLDGNGIQTLSVSAGVQFDLAASGQRQTTGWVARGDGLLALDRNHDGQINDGSELFGMATRLADGNRAADGYAALADLDSNQDGVIDRQDNAYAELRVWVDRNSDGISESAELFTLPQLQIRSLSLAAQLSAALDQGNQLGLAAAIPATMAAAMHWPMCGSVRVRSAIFRPAGWPRR